MRKVKEDRKTGCWIWTAYRDPKGYGHFWFDGSVQRAHRFAFQVFKGILQLGRQGHHECYNPACCHPLHQADLSLEENVEHAHKTRRQREVAPF